VIHQSESLPGDAIRVELRIVRDLDGERNELSETLVLAPDNRDALNTDYSASFDPGDVPLRSLSADLELEADHTWFLGGNARLVPLSSEARPLWPAGRFIVTARNGTFSRWEFPRFGRFRLVKQDGSVRVVAPIIDRSRCGLSVWPNARWVTRREKIHLEISKTLLVHPEECGWIEPYPDGARAVICLTDHADFDSPGKARLTADHLTRRDICITKSVFPASDLPSLTAWEETGLDNAQYRASMEQLLASGSEIAAHGFTPKRDAPPLSECKRRLELLRPYGVKTWIDHGTGEYLFSRGGKLADGVGLDTLLEANGVENYWSYFDVWDNPFRAASSVFSRRRGGDVVSDFFDQHHGWTGATAREALWFALHEFRNLVGDGNDVAIRKRPLHFQSWRRAIEWYGVARQVRAAPFGLYGRDGAVYQQSLSSPWVFDTVLLNHLALQLAPRMIDRLIDGNGLMIAHCYIACEHDYARRNAFRRIAGRLAVDPAFETALDYVDDRQRSGELRTLSFAQLRRCLEFFVRARLRRTQLGWMTELADESTPYEANVTRARSTHAFDAATFRLSRRALTGRENAPFN